MTKKEKPKNKSKPYEGRKKMKAETKIGKKIKDLEKKAEYAHRRAIQAHDKSLNFAGLAFNAKNEHDKARYSRLVSQYLDIYNAGIKKYKHYKSRINKARTKKRRVVKTSNTDQAAMASLIQEHEKKFTGEGNMVIFPTKSGQESDVVFFAPVNTESESNSSNVTSYAVDKGAPRKDYVRFASKTVTIDGLIADTDTGTAHDKWLKLRTWHSYAKELTFRGDIYYKHLIISDLHREFTGYQNTMRVSITFTFVRAAKITTSKNKKHRKSSKSSKTIVGSRNKKYTALTIKSGDTLYQLSKKYGKSVSWLARVNKIKNPNVIRAGQKIRVK